MQKKQQRKMLLREFPLVVCTWYEQGIKWEWLAGLCYLNITQQISLSDDWRTEGRQFMKKRFGHAGWARTSIIFSQHQQKICPSSRLAVWRFLPHTSVEIQLWSLSIYFPHYRDGTGQQGGVYQLHSNGHSEGVSPNSSQLSMEGRESTMVTRTQKQHVSHNVSCWEAALESKDNGRWHFSPTDYCLVHNWDSLFQVTTTTKTIREVQYIGPDGQPIDYIPDENGGQFAYENHNPISDYQNHQFADYQMYAAQQQQQQLQQHQQYQDYNRPPTPPTPSERSSSPPPSHRVPGRNHHRSYLDPTSLWPG